MAYKSLLTYGVQGDHRCYSIARAGRALSGKISLIHGIHATAQHIGVEWPR